MSKLYIVGTPIGNLEDMSYRAVRVLGEVDLILCEDTRTSGKLLGHYGISTPTMSYHSHTKTAKTEKIFDLLEEGKDIALVSDAGTPTISDPGVLLVSQVRGHFGDRVEVIAIPGASALTAALSVSGVPSSEFLFLGFLPHKKGRMTLFTEIANSKRTSVFYESPHRIMKSLGVLAEVLADDRRVVIARELTKIHEEVLGGTPREILDFFNTHPEKIRGEFVVVVSGV